MSIYDKLTANTASTEPSQMSAIEKVLQAKKGKMGGAVSSTPSLSEQAVNQDVKGQLREGAVAGGLQNAMQQSGIQSQQAANVQAKQLQEQQYAQGQQGIESAANMQLKGNISGESMANRGIEATRTRKIDAINANASKILAQLAAEKKMTTDDIFSSFRQDSAELDARKDVARLEQLGTVLALRDQQYMDELQRIGDRRQLYDKTEYAKERQRLIYGDNLNAMMDQLKFQRSEDITDRQFRFDMAKMNANQALEIAMAAIRDSNASAIASGAISATSTIATKYDWNSPATTLSHSKIPLKDIT